ncbi:dihydroneopterin aldolase [Lipingzhangella halophila]|uniref:7,8-dihydroneopterin aldolase n=1 Tax=Lipingzhangella halophila TaxID=1783352 RepID=A0A7W7W120_9ACTN|nr:dihydroneopterin aldolase [Lipingzhangella halophila]MBB4929250.1 dihydroneopterin aldolase [Lipingzhangella halophila]
MTGTREREDEARRSDRPDRLDRIAVRGLRAWGYHGVLEQERRDGQTFVVDVVLGVDSREAARTDDLAHTVHYGVLSERLVGAVAGEPVALIETLAQRLADTCLAETAVHEVEVTVHKPDAPIPHEFSDVTVTIVRER